MNETVCVECRHHIHISGAPCHKRVNVGHWCYAPWPKTKDFVTGLLKPVRIACTNKGDCEHFERPWLVRLWNQFLDYHLFKETS